MININILYYIPLVIIFISVPVSIKYRTFAYVLSVISSIAFIFITFNRYNYITYFYMISGAVWIISSIYSISYSKSYGKWLSPLFLLTISGMMVILYSSNFLIFITGWEIMSIPAYVTVAVNKRNDAEAYVFMFFSEISTVFIITAAVMSYFYTGNFGFNILTNDYVLLIFTIGAMSKMGLTPFMISEWLPIAHGSAPANSSALFSATMTLMGVYGITKIALLSPQSQTIGILFTAIGVISVIFGSLYAYISENMKSLGGFSTIENNGTLLSAIGLYVTFNDHILRMFIIISVVIFAMGHSIAKTGLFMSVGNTGAEYFSMVSKNSSSANKIGKFFIFSSLSGLFPGIGGLGTWMVLESFFMGAYLGGISGLASLIGGSVLAIGEGFATAAMFKIYYFSDKHDEKIEKNDLKTYTVLATGLLLILLFAVSVIFIKPEFLSGIPEVLVFNGFMIESKFNENDFGLVTPFYILVLIIIFSLLTYGIFGKPKTRKVMPWNNGVSDFDGYTSFSYSSGIRLILKRILKTGNKKSGMETVDIFWFAMIKIARGFRNGARYIGYRIMNSSIGYYMVYMIIAFIIIIIIVSL